MYRVSPTKVRFASDIARIPSACELFSWETLSKDMRDKLAPGCAVLSPDGDLVTTIAVITRTASERTDLNFGRYVISVTIIAYKKQTAPSTGYPVLVVEELEQIPKPVQE